MRNMLGARIGEKHTYRDWNLGWIGVTIDFPEAKTYLVDLPGGNGSIDLTTTLTGGDVKYKDRNISMEFNLRDEDFIYWADVTTAIADYLHGQRLRIILDIDTTFYYYGRLMLDTEKTDKEESKIVLSGSVDPYKYELYSSLEKWRWDDLSFVNGIIREYKDLKVNGSLEVIIPGRRMPVVPIIECSTAMTVKYNGNTFSLPPGKSRAFDINTHEGNNHLIISGNGNISIDYRGGVL